MTQHVTRTFHTHSLQQNTSCPDVGRVSLSFMCESSFILWGKQYHDHCFTKALTLWSFNTVECPSLFHYYPRCVLMGQKTSSVLLPVLSVELLENQWPGLGSWRRPRGPRRWAMESDDRETRSTEVVWTERLWPLSLAPRTASHLAPAGFALVKARLPGKAFLFFHRWTCGLGLNPGWRLMNRASLVQSGFYHGLFLLLL